MARVTVSDKDKIRRLRDMLKKQTAEYEHVAAQKLRLLDEIKQLRAALSKAVDERDADRKRMEDMEKQLWKAAGTIADYNALTKVLDDYQIERTTEALAEYLDFLLKQATDLENQRHTELNARMLAEKNLLSVIEIGSAITDELIDRLLELAEQRESVLGAHPREVQKKVAKLVRMLKSTRPFDEKSPFEIRELPCFRIEVQKILLFNDIEVSFPNKDASTEKKLADQPTTESPG